MQLSTVQRPRPAPPKQEYPKLNDPTPTPTSSPTELQLAPPGRRFVARLLDFLIYLAVPAGLLIGLWMLLGNLVLHRTEDSIESIVESDHAGEAVVRTSNTLIESAFAWVFMIGVAVIGIVIIIVVHIVSEVATPKRTGQTSGKKWMGLRLVADNPTAPLRTGQLLGRWAVLHVAPFAVMGVMLPAGATIARFLAVVGLAALAAPIWFTTDRRGLHDRLVGTKVIDVRESPRDHPVHPHGRT